MMKKIKKEFRKTGSMALIGVLLAIFIGCVPVGLDIPDLASGEGAVVLAIQGTKSQTAVAATSDRARPAAAVTSIDIPVIGIDGVEQGVITVTSALIALKEIEFQLPEDELAQEAGTETEDEFEFEGPFIVDLLADTVTPELDFAVLPSGEYEEIEFKIDKIEGDESEEDGVTPIIDATSPLFGNSIYLAGSYTGITLDGTVTGATFSMTYDIDESFELKDAGETAVTFLVEEGTLNPIIIAFRLNRWFNFTGAEDDFNSLTTTAGAVVLDNNQETIRDLVKDNIEDSADYGVDADEDGELEADEDDDPDEEDTEDFIEEEE